MKRCLMLLALLLILSVLTPLSVFAAGEDELSSYVESAQDALYSQLDSETRDLLGKVGLASIDPDGGVAVSWNALVETFRGSAKSALKDALRDFCGSALSVLLLAIVTALVGQKGAGALQTAGLCLVVLQSVSVVRPLLSAGATLLSTSAGFMKAFLPVYAGLVAFSGAPAAALSVQTLVFGLGEGLSAFAEILCVQGTGAFLGFACACALSEHVQMQRFLSAASRTLNWVLGLLCAVFTGVLGARSVLSAAADTAAGKSVRFLLSSAIPVVGAAMSDAYSSLVASIHLIRGSFAAVGVVVLLALHLPALLQGLTALFSFKILAAFSNSLGTTKTAGVFQSFSLALKFVLLLGVLELFLLLISIGLLLQMKGGA